MKEVLLYLHQLPQNLLGLLVILFTRAKYNDISYKKDENFWISKHFSFGVSLGNYIIFGNRPVSWVSLKHEQGHRIQSRRLGWLYLIVIGIPSAARNLWDRIAHSEWDYADRIKWYYSSFPEKQADELGGVNRWQTRI